MKEPSIRTLSLLFAAVVTLVGVRWFVLQPSAAVPLAPKAQAAASVSVVDFGAKGDGKTDDSPAFEAAMAAVEAQLDRDQTGGVVRVPPSSLPYLLSRPVRIRRTGVSLVGESMGASRLKTLGGGVGVLIGNHDLLGSALHRIPGQYNHPSLTSQRGIRFDTSHAVFPLGSLNHGPVQGGTFAGWPHVSAMTLEVFIGNPAGGLWAPGQFLMGMTDDSQRGKPWSLWTAAGGLEFSYSATGQADWTTLGFPLAGAGPWRITIQVDLSAGQAAIWVDGRLVKPAGIPQATGFADEGFVNFTVAFPGPVASLRSPPRTPLDLYGLRLMAGPLYQWRTSPETTPNGQTSDDRRFFAFPWGSPILGYLPLDEPDAPAGIAVRSDRGVEWGHAIAGPQVDAALDPIPSRNQVRNLAIDAAGGAGVLISNALQTELDHVQVIDSMTAVGSVPCAATYTTLLNGCILSGNRSSVDLTMALMSARDLWINHGQIRLFGCSSNVDQLMVAFPGRLSPIRIAGYTYGGSHCWRGVVLDNEGDGFADGEAALWASQGGYTPNTLEVDRFYTPHVGLGATVFRLDGLGQAWGAAYQPSRFTAVNIEAPGADSGGLIRASGQGWAGTYSPRTVRVPTVQGDPLGALVPTP